MTARTMIDIEALLHWTMQAEFAHAIARPGGLLAAEASAAGFAERARRSRDGTAKLDMIAGLGCIPQESLLFLNHCHPDAEAVYGLASRMLVDADLAVIVECARSGNRPDWRPDIKPLGVRYEVNYSATGDVGRAVVRCNGRTGMRHCRVEYYDRSREIAAFRDRYLRWWDAMTALAASLVGSNLTRWSVISRPAADREPWSSSRNFSGP